MGPVVQGAVEVEENLGYVDLANLLQFLWVDVYSYVSLLVIYLREKGQHAYHFRLA